MFGADTKLCIRVFGQKRISRADSEVNADAANAVTAVTSPPIATAKRSWVERRDIDLTMIRRKFAKHHELFFV